jgi:hypothetical protein
VGIVGMDKAQYLTIIMTMVYNTDYRWNDGRDRYF